MLFDSHCHFTTDPGLKEIEGELAAKIADSELGCLVDVGTDLPTSFQAVSSANKYNFCYAAVGFHPSELASCNDEALLQIEKLAKEEPKVVAIGEIGLDFHWPENPPQDVQVYWFKRQIELAKKLGKPICIHSRDADQLTMDVLKECGAFGGPSEGPLAPGQTRVLMHCYSGSAEMAKEYIKLGAYISVAGPITYKNNRKGIEVVKVIGLAHLLVETDSPYLAPEPLRGTKNVPTNVRYTAAKVAEILEIDFSQVAEKTAENAKRFYGIK